LHIEPGWEPALEAVLRERLTGLEIRRLEHVSAFASDAPPARLAFYQLPAAAPPASPVASFKSLTTLLRISDPDLRSLLNDWLHGVYVSDDVGGALASRADLPRGGLLVV
jgi:chromosome segregation protein